MANATASEWSQHVTNNNHVDLADEEYQNVSLSDTQIKELIRSEFISVLHSRQISPAHRTVLYLVFSLFIIAGTVGNLIVCLVAARNRQMCVSRNVFIVNLAISDLILCLITQPLNLVRLSSQPIWSLGDVACRMTAFLPAVNVFVSTLSITAIALDRLTVIVYSSKQCCCNCPLRLSLYIWGQSFVLAFPMLIFSGQLEVELKDTFIFNTCVESPLVHYARLTLIYSIASTIFQYVLPIGIILFAYARICRKIRKRFVMVRRPSGQSVNMDVADIHVNAAAALNEHMTNCANDFSQQQDTRFKRRQSRIYRTYLLLVAVTVTFVISWLPLNILNILADIDHKLLPSNLLIISFCNLMVLSSAVVNPILYGWLNDNFRNEFAKLFSVCRRTHPGEL